MSAFLLASGRAEQVPVVCAARGIFLADAFLAFTSIASCPLLTETTIGVRKADVEVRMAGRIATTTSTRESVGIDPAILVLTLRRITSTSL